MPDYIFEHSEMSFSEKFSALRRYYNLTSRDMAALLNYKSPSNIAYFEKYPMTNRPSYQALISIHQLFGVSIDWLIGLSDIPYNNESLTQAEIAQDLRFIADPLVIPEDSDTPENIISSIKKGVFSRDVIQKKLVLQDRFTLIFLLNYVAFAFTQYYLDNRSNILKKKLSGLLELLGLKNNSKIITNPTGVTNVLKKHPDYAIAFLKFMDTLKSPFEIPHTLHPALVRPGQFYIEKLEHSILEDRWNIFLYLEENNITSKKPKELPHQ